MFGGSLYIESKSVSIEFTKFMNNSAVEGGAIFVENAELKTETCTFEKNVATHKGGAVRVDDKSSITTENCRFLSNKAVDGGAVHVTSSSYSFVNNTILVKNIASQYGGALALEYDTEIGSDPMRSVTFENITCISNQAISGGCIFIASAVLILKSSRVAHNHVSVCGAGIDIKDSRMQVGI